MDLLPFIWAALANLLVCSGLSFAILKGFRETDLHEAQEAKKMLSLQIDLLSRRMSFLEKG
jgi:hypothetical protein